MAVRATVRGGTARLQCAAVGLYAVVAVALAALLVSSILRALPHGHGFEGVWWLLGFPCLYAAGMAAGSARLRFPRRRARTQRRAFRLLIVHALCGWVGTLAIARLTGERSAWPWLRELLPEGVAMLMGIATVVAMLAAGVLALRMPAHARRDGVLLLTALVGGLFALANLALLALGLALLSSGHLPD